MRCTWYFQDLTSSIEPARDKCSCFTHFIFPRGRISSSTADVDHVSRQLINLHLRKVTNHVREEVVRWISDLIKKLLRDCAFVDKTPSVLGFGHSEISVRSNRHHREAYLIPENSRKNIFSDTILSFFFVFTSCKICRFLNLLQRKYPCDVKEFHSVKRWYKKSLCDRPMYKQIAQLNSLKHRYSTLNTLPH